MAAAAILKNRKIVISPQNFDRCTLIITNLFLRSIAYRNDVYQKRFFAEYCIVGIPHNTAIYSELKLAELYDYIRI